MVCGLTAEYFISMEEVALPTAFSYVPEEINKNKKELKRGTNKERVTF